MKPTDTSPLLNEKVIKRIQGIVGALLYVVRAANNKVLAALSAIGAQQAAATEDTAAAIEQLLDYVATRRIPMMAYFSEKVIRYWRHTQMQDFFNESRARIRAGAHIFLSENEPEPKLNGPVLTIAQIIKTVTASAAEAEMAALFITAKKDDTTAPYTRRNGLATTLDTNQNCQLNSGWIH